MVGNQVDNYKRLELTRKSKINVNPQQIGGPNSKERRGLSPAF